MTEEITNYESEIPENTSEKDRVSKMDELCDHLVALALDVNTSHTQKQRLFLAAVDWLKVRERLTKVEDGGKLKEMADGIERGKRTPAEKRRNHHKPKDGIAIRSLIRTIGKHRRDTERDKDDPEREDIGAAGGNGRVPDPPVGDVARNGDVVVDGNRV